MTERRSLGAWKKTVWRGLPARDSTGWKPVPHLAVLGALNSERRSRPRGARAAYVLLETVIATGLLITALATIGVQVQNARLEVKIMRRETRALTLAEQFLAEMDLGLIELTSLNDIEEGDFGPRFPDWGWRMTTEEMAIADLFLLKVEILFLMRDGAYRQESFEYEKAETMQTLYAVRATPGKIDFASDFGLAEDELAELTDRMAEAGMPDFDPGSFDLRDFMGNTPSEELLQQLPLLMDKFGFEIEDVEAFLPPELLEELKGLGLFGQEGEAEGEDGPQ